MRIRLFLTMLFPVSLIGGAALAEKPHDGAAVREPRSMEQLRAHGDTVDKVYSAPVERAPEASQPQAGRSVLDPSASRVNCSDTGADCGSSRSANASGPEASARDGGSRPQSAGRAASRPSSLDKVLGNDRTDFNEAGEDQGMSARAANRVWSHAAAEQHVSGAGMRVAGQQQVDRKEQQGSSARMSCNEADACSMSVKAARKEWASASIKAGTWSGPAAVPVSDAARRIAAQRAAASASEQQTRATKAAARAEGAAHGAAGAAARDGDHEH
jgi:hypothetical protein